MDDTIADSTPDAAASSAEFQPTVFGVGCYLSRKAEKLLKILWGLIRSSHRKGKTFAWPRQTTLAKMMGCSRRTVQLGLDELVKAGLVVKTRTQRGNIYVLPDPNEQQPIPDAQNRAVPDAQNCASHAQNPEPVCASHAQNCASYYMTFKNDSRKDSSKDSFAAADLFVAVEIQDGSRQLQSLGLPAPLADRYAAKDPDLALAVIPFLQSRFALPGVRNKTGFIRGVLDKPIDYSFTRDADGHWHAPVKDSDTSAEERKRRDHDRRLAQARERNAAPPSPWPPEWQALPTSKQDAIKAEVRRRHHGGREVPEGAIFRGHCVAVLREVQTSAPRDTKPSATKPETPQE